MGKELPKSLHDILNSTDTLDITALLRKIIDYSVFKLGCKAGSAYLFDGATGQLELKSDSLGIKKRFSITPGVGVVEKSFNKPHAFSVFSGEDLNAAMLPYDMNVFGKIRSIVSMPVGVFNRTELVFCFVYEKQGLGENQTDNGLYPEEIKKVEELWKESKQSEVGRAIHRIRMHGIPSQLYEAGQSVSRLKTEADRFITRLQESFRQNQKRVPDLIYVQLIDQSRQLAITIQGVGTHQRLQVFSSHSLDSHDIHADIIRNRNVEIVSGFDHDRFDPEIYEKYEHHRYVRMWMPLFPFPVARLMTGRQSAIETALNEIMSWEEGDKNNEKMRRMIGKWIDEERPPAELIYGTLELGYELDNYQNLTLNPWTPELAMWALARVFEHSHDLYRTTIPGVLDRIGRLLASGPVSCLTKVLCVYPNQTYKEMREYPISWKWPAAVPVLQNQEIIEWNDDNTEGWNIWQESYGPLAVLYNIDDLVYIDSNSDFSEEYVHNIWMQDIHAAGESVKIAFSLYESVIAPIELFECETNPVNVGTHVENPVISTLLRDVAHANGAVCAAFFCFESKSSIISDAKISDQDQGFPIEWFEKSGLLDLKNKDRILSLAKETAKLRRPKYMEYLLGDSSIYWLSLIPLELMDGNEGILTFLFPFSKKLSASVKRALENNIPRWGHYLSLNRLIQRRRFNVLMMKFRHDIIRARDAATRAKPGESSVDIFLRNLLTRFVTHMDTQAAFITLFSETETGPNRVKQYWCCKEDGKLNVESHEYLNKNIVVPCFKPFSDYKVRIINDKERACVFRKIIQSIRIEIQCLQHEGLTSESEKFNQLELLYKKLDDTCCSMLTFPIHEDLSGVKPVNGNFCLILPGEHYFDSIHKETINELGELIAQTLTQVRLLNDNQVFERHSKHADFRVEQFENANTVNNIIGSFLRGLGKRPESEKDIKGGKYDHWPLSDDVVIWSLSSDGTELVARSGKGNGLKALTEPGKEKDVIKPNQHPLFYNEDIPCEKSGSPPVLKKEFRIWTFNLKNRDKNEPYNYLHQAYFKETGFKWMISFPIIDAANRVYGAVDLLKAEPFPSEEEMMIEKVLHRLSHRLYSSIQRVNLSRTKSIAETLFKEAKHYVENFKIFEAYKRLVEILKEEFNCEQCDLFMDNHGEMLLYASTSQNAPKNENERARYRIGKNDNGIDVLAACLKTGKPRICHKWENDIPMEHISVELKKFIRKSKFPERMILPLTPMNNPEEGVDGLVQLHSPKKTLNPDDDSKYLKKNTRFSAEDFSLGQYVGMELLRITKMVQMAEQQVWLINELGHSLGQPLQVLQYYIIQPIRALLNAGWDKNGVRNMQEDIAESFQMVHEALNQLSYFTSMGKSTPAFSFQDLQKLIIECCTFMAVTAMNRKIRIEYGEVRFIKELPLDRYWMRIALINLLNNAIKYSWVGRAVVVSAVEEEDSIIIKITNHGIGIPMNDFDRIFKPYFRSGVPDAFGTRSGTGIGLPIIRNAIEKIHEGQVSVTSYPISEKDKKRVKATGKISDIEHQTTFIIKLNRDKLVTMETYLNERRGFSHDS